MKKRYGISPEQMQDMLAGQGGVCACCGGSDPGSVRGWVIDHCHQNGHVRGILCDPCNVGLGRFFDDTEKLRKAIAYLERTAEAPDADAA